MSVVLKAHEPSAKYLLRLEPALIRGFELCVTAPEGIAKLRGFIRALAISGKLVPQQTESEPASTLLERIKEEKKRLVESGKIRRDTPLPPASVEAVPFDIPAAWTWVPLQYVGYTQTGTTPDKKSPALYGKSIPFIKPGDIYPQCVNYENEGLSQLGLNDSARLAPAGSLLMVCIGTLGKCNVISRDCSFNQQINSITPLLIDSQFLLTVLRSRYFYSEVWARSSSTTIAIVNKGKWEGIPVPLPPLAEQHRIVTRVEELMKLCDALEARGRLADEQHARLTSTLFDALAASESPHALTENWQRIAEHFDLLLDRPEAIDAFEQTILQLAVRGLLLPQDVGDDPTDALLQIVRAEKAKLIAKGKLRQDKGWTAITDAEQMFPLRTGWQWVRFGDVSINRDGERIPISSDDRQQRAKTFDYYGASGVIDKIDGYLFDQTLLLIGEDGANLISRSTPIAFLASGKYWVNNHAHVIDTTHPELMDYLCLYINAISLEQYVTGTAQPKMNQAKMNSIPIALPPLAEQRRIVTRVEELRQLCAQLRERLTLARRTQSQLAEALVAEVA